MVERTSSWHNAHKNKLTWCTERVGRVVAFWIAFSEVVTIVRRLVGGANVTVIPFSFLPFVPEQDFIHYFAHFLYGLAQLPLIGIMIQQIRRIPKARA